MRTRLGNHRIDGAKATSQDSVKLASWVMLLIGSRARPMPPAGRKYGGRIASPSPRTDRLGPISPARALSGRGEARSHRSGAALPPPSGPHGGLRARRPDDAGRRQADGGGGTGPDSARQVERAAVELDERLGQRQAQPRPPLFSV